jgi:sporulation protein YlmC with PRC-barrel domain
VETDIDPRSLIGRKAFDSEGHKIGTVDEVYLDDATGLPEWAAVRTGLFSRDAFVPLEPSSLVENTLRIPFERALIKDAPDFGVGRHLSPEQELQLYHHYGLELPAAQPQEAPASLSDEDGERDFGHVAGQDD